MANGNRNLSSAWARAVGSAVLTAAMFITPAMAQNGTLNIDTQKNRPGIVADAGDIARPRLAPRTTTPSAKAEMTKAATSAVTTAPFTLNIDDMPSGGTDFERIEAREAEIAAEKAKLETSIAGENGGTVTPKPAAAKPNSTITGTVTTGPGYTIYNLGDPSDARAGNFGVQRLMAKLREDAPKGQEPIITANYYYEARPGVKSKNSELQTSTLEALTVVLAEDSQRDLVFISAPALRKGPDGKLVQLHYGAMRWHLDNENGLGPQERHEDMGKKTVVPLSVVKGPNGQTEEGFAVGLFVTSAAQAKKAGLPESEIMTELDIKRSLAGNYGAVVIDSNKALAAAKKAEGTPAITTTVASLNKD